MTIENEYISNIRKSLFSGNEDIIKQALADIRSNGTSQVIELLLDLHVISSNMVIKNNILSLLSDLKDTSSAKILIDSLTSSKYTTIKKELLSICWQNGIDFSNDIQIFATILIEEDLEIAFEAYTVIYELHHKLKEDQRKHLIDYFIDNLSSQNEQKKELILLLLKNLK